METQTLCVRYIGKAFLIELLRALFGSQFRIEDHDDFLVLSAPRRIGRPDAEDCCHIFTVAGYKNSTIEHPIQVSNTKMDHLERFKTRLKALRQPNFEQRRLIPQRALYGIMTADTIQEVVRECGIPAYRVQGTAEAITRGAHKIFAILVLIGRAELIAKFIEHDQLQQSQLDQKLPFDRRSLEAFLPASVAEEFEEKQWEFAAPVFHKQVLPRILEDNIILPFGRDREIGQGGFGTVHEVSLIADHQKDGHAVLVRKEFRPGTNWADYEAELYNLSLLNQLQHPNIIELLGSYTYRDKHNFVFPCIHGGDLAQLLREPHRREAFRFNRAFYVALSELSSAIEVLHYFTASDLDLKLIGCHRDLKPSNILVDGGHFMLADFGLSRFTPISDDSKSIFGHAQGSYLAPECQNIEDFSMFPVGRSSDIWSFGCIIAEI
ncbi:hypothetical protein FQN49_006513, partial [Arthroderma sp. PD_2]